MAGAATLSGGWRPRPSGGRPPNHGGLYASGCKRRVPDAMTGIRFASRTSKVQRVALVSAFSLGLVLTVALVGQSQEATPSGCPPGQTRWESTGMPDSTFKTIDEAIAATVSNHSWTVSNDEIAEAAATSEDASIDSGPISVVLHPQEQAISEVHITMAKLGESAYTAGDAVWCATE